MNRYREGRKQSGLSIGEGSNITGIGVVRLSDIELDRITPTEDEKRAMADRYGCSVEWLRGDVVEVPAGFLRVLDEAQNISDHDRNILLQFAASLPRNQLTARERLDTVAARHAAPDVPRAAKVRHVRSQRQIRDHHCHWTGCDKQVPPAMWGCKAHWFRLPKELRDRVWATYRVGQEVSMTPSREYLQVADDVQQWIREHGGAA